MITDKCSNKAVLWFNRAAFAIVFAINVWCAISFVLFPQSFVGAYELSGISGEAAVRGMGVVFLMWNATYPVYIAHPYRYKVLGGIIIVQQIIGCVGETAILLTLGSGHAVLASSILRFIAFDAAGLVIEAAAFAALIVKGRVENENLRRESLRSERSQ